MKFKTVTGKILITGYFQKKLVNGVHVCRAMLELMKSKVCAPCVAADFAAFCYYTKQTKFFLDV